MLLSKYIPELEWETTDVSYSLSSLGSAKTKTNTKLPLNTYHMVLYGLNLNSKSLSFHQFSKFRHEKMRHSQLFTNNGHFRSWRRPLETRDVLCETTQREESRHIEREKGKTARVQRCGFSLLRWRTRQIELSLLGILTFSKRTKFAGWSSQWVSALVLVVQDWLGKWKPYE